MLRHGKGKTCKRLHKRPGDSIQQVHVNKRDCSYCKNTQKYSLFHSTDIPKSTVNDIIKRYRKYGQQGNKNKSGKPKLSSSRQDRVLVRSCISDRWLTAPILKNMWSSETGVMASTSTVKRRLADAGLNGRIARGSRCYYPVTSTDSGVFLGILLHQTLED